MKIKQGYLSLLIVIIALLFNNIIRIYYLNVAITDIDYTGYVNSFIYFFGWMRSIVQILFWPFSSMIFFLMSYALSSNTNSYKYEKILISIGYGYFFLIIITVLQHLLYVKLISDVTSYIDKDTTIREILAFINCNIFYYYITILEYFFYLCMLPWSVFSIYKAYKLTFWKSSIVVLVPFAIIYVIYIIV